MIKTSNFITKLVLFANIDQMKVGFSVSVCKTVPKSDKYFDTCSKNSRVVPTVLTWSPFFCDNVFFEASETPCSFRP